MLTNIKSTDVEYIVYTSLEGFIINYSDTGVPGMANAMAGQLLQRPCIQKCGLDCPKDELQLSIFYFLCAEKRIVNGNTTALSRQASLPIKERIQLMEISRLKNPLTKFANNIWKSFQVNFSCA